jgi:hypothetical protein
LCAKSIAALLHARKNNGTRSIQSDVRSAGGSASVDVTSGAATTGSISFPIVEPVTRIPRSTKSWTTFEMSGTVMAELRSLWSKREISSEDRHSTSSTCAPTHRYLSFTRSKRTKCRCERQRKAFRLSCQRFGCTALRFKIFRSMDDTWRGRHASFSLR